MAEVTLKSYKESEFLLLLFKIQILESDGDVKKQDDHFLVRVCHHLKLMVCHL